VGDSTGSRGQEIVSGAIQGKLQNFQRNSAKPEEERGANAFANHSLGRERGGIRPGKQATEDAGNFAKNQTKSRWARLSQFYNPKKEKLETQKKKAGRRISGGKK